MRLAAICRQERKKREERREILALLIDMFGICKCVDWTVECSGWFANSFAPVAITITTTRATSTIISHLIPYRIEYPIASKPS